MSGVIFLLVAVLTFASILAALATNDRQAVLDNPWKIYTVENATADTGECWFPGISLALDSLGDPHLTYHSARPGENLRYASWDGQGFAVDTVVPRNSSISGTALALDSANGPHVAFFSPAAGNLTFHLEYAVRVGGAWVVDTIDPAHTADPNATFVRASMVLDANDRPRLIYPANDINTTRYAVWTGSDWSVTNLAQPSATGSLVLDSGGRPRFVLDLPGGTVAYIAPSGPWMNITGALWGGPQSFALDRGDRPHVSYLSESGILKQVYVATLNGAQWDIQAVDTGTTFSNPVPLALDGSGQPHVAYPSGGSTNYHLKYASWDGTTWNRELVDGTNAVGADVSLALDRDGNPHIGYFDRKHCTIKYATKASLKPPPPQLAYAPALLDFGMLAEGATANRTFTVWNSGGGELNYTLAGNAVWIVGIAPPNGTSRTERDNVTVTVRTTGLPAGLHSGSVSIASNGGNGSVSVLVNVTRPSRSVLFKFTPETLNLKSMGRWITAFLSPVNASPGDIDPSTLLLNDVVQPSWWNLQGTRLMVKFDRAAVEAILHVSDSVDVRITGSWMDGERFEAHDTIRVIDP